MTEKERFFRLLTAAIQLMGGVGITSAWTFKETDKVLRPNRIYLKTAPGVKIPDNWTLNDCYDKLEVFYFKTQGIDNHLYGKVGE